MRDLSLKELKKLSDRLHNDTYSIKGKYNNKQEFVTCGGVKLSEVNFTTMESKLCRGLYFAGEILDIDGLTGGFNLQNAWTTGYIAGQSCAKKDVLEDT
jgi:predicted flavoprotein YhiN